MLLSTYGEQFAGFGTSKLIALRPPRSIGVQLADDRLASRRLVRTNSPTLPGVYGMVDAGGRLLYVGKAKNLRNRLLSYFLPGDPECKARRIIERTDRLVWEPAPHEFTALVRELELIRRFQPPLNVAGQPGRLRRGFVCLGREPAAYLYLAAQPQARSRAVFGPVSLGARTRSALRRLNDLLQLRDCPQQVPMIFSDQLELFSQPHVPACLRHELGTCSGPCAARCTASEYAGQIRRAEGFLSGRDRSLVERLAAEMNAAASERAFERAAALRDSHDDLVWLDDQLARLRHVRRDYSFVYPLAGRRGQVWHWIVRGQLVAVTAGPRNRRLSRRAWAVAEQIRQAAAASTEQLPEDVGLLHLVAGWFRSHPGELDRTHRLAELPQLLA